MKKYLNIVLFIMVLLSFTSLSAKKINLDNHNKQRDIVVQSNDTTSDDAVTVGGKLFVNGEVDGDAVSIGGIVHINGRITGDLVLIGSSGEIGPNTVVEGSFVNIGSSLNIDKKAVFNGGKTSINLGPINRLISNRFLHSYGAVKYKRIGRGPFHFIEYDHSWVRMVSKFIITYFLILALVVLFKRGTYNVEKTMNINPFATFLAGFLVELLLLPSMIVLMVSIIGLPLIPILILVFFVAMTFGSAVLTYMIGKYSVKLFRWRNVHIAITVLIGLVVLSIIPLLSMLTFLISSAWPNILFISFTFTQMYIVVTYAIGSVTLSRFGTRIYKNRPEDIEE